MILLKIFISNKKMKIILINIIILLLLSCSSEQDKKPSSDNSVVLSQVNYKHIKDSVLYMDSDSNIYIKHEICIMRRKDNNKVPDVRFFDMVLVNDSIVVELKKVIDIETFIMLDSNTFKDKNFVYYFSNHPSTFPSIVAK